MTHWIDLRSQQLSYQLSVRFYIIVKIPSSASSHKDLLNVAVDEDILSHDLSDRLDKYRGFRHFFVHAYGILLEEEELRPLAENLPKVWDQFEQEIENFIKKLTT